jgi:hypothetical protein
MLIETQPYRARTRPGRHCKNALRAFCAPLASLQRAPVVAVQTSGGPTTNGSTHIATPPRIAARRARHRRRALLALLALLAACSPSVAARPPASLAASPHAYWGASIDGGVYSPGHGDAPADLSTWNLFESHAGRKVSILHWTQPWYGGGWEPFPTSDMNTVRGRGAIPLLTWNSWDYSAGAGQPAFALRNVANGATASYKGKTFDQFVTSWANGAKAWGHPFFLRFDQEMNGWWQFPWATADNPHTGGTINNNRPQDYVNAWRHVHDLFARAGASNVTWVWCPNISNSNTTPLSQLYPGDGYVDWTCLDGYNNSASNWQSFAQVFGGDSTNSYHNSYAEVTGLTAKPVMLGEWASLEAGDGGAKKAAWITTALQTQLPANYPKIHAVVWFNGIPPAGKNDGGAQYQIESTSRSQSAFANAIAASYFAGNAYGGLNTSPIPAVP